MLKKIYNIAFVVAFLAVLAVPLVFTKWESGGVSTEENRNLAKFPTLKEEGKWNEQFTSQFETWFMDHMGFRDELINTNAKLQFRVFNRMLDNSDYHIGPRGDINYATEAMILDYAHLNLRTPEEVEKRGQAFQYVSDWLTAQDIEFYYVQCYDKHTIYPEQFTNHVRQVGDISKTDQIITYLNEHTDVRTISLKEPLIAAKSQYETYTNWGDPSHWSPRGAFIGYQYIMEQINLYQEEPLRILSEADYYIEIVQGGITLNKVVHRDEYYEKFTLKSPMATEQDNSVMGQWQDQYHRVWKNPNAGNDTKLLLLCDSYFANEIVEDFAESYSEVWLIWADYIGDLPQILEIYDADVVIFECAERVDRTGQVFNLYQKLLEQ